MKKFLGILVIYLFWYNISSASTYKNDIFGLSNPDKQLVCDHDETSEISAWNFTDIKDEILGDWVMVRPLGVIKDKNNKIQFSIPKSPLGQGLYSISLEVWVNGGKADTVGDVGVFENTPGDFIGNGIPDQEHSLFHTNSVWS